MKYVLIVEEYRYRNNCAIKAIAFIHEGKVD
jgi:hypothetical protein